MGQAVLVPPIPAATLVASVLAATDGTHPERRSLSRLPAPFDAQAYIRDPAAYLAIIEPGRVFQSVAAGPGVWEIRPDGRPWRAVPSGGRTGLAALAPPRAPVSWHCAEGGVFAESTVNSITVQADDAGIARVTYIATPGTTGDATVLVASPICSGRAAFTIHINE